MKSRIAVTAGGFDWLDAALKHRGFDVLHTSPCPNIGAPVASHADMLMFRMGDGFLLERSQTDLAGSFEKSGFAVRLLTRQFSAAYPGDVPLNAAVVGDTLICNPKTVLPEIIAAFKRAGREVIPVRQGYAKCSVCVVSDDSIITEDAGIHRACLAAGMDSLLIAKGFVALKGHDCGFIGGASGNLGGKVFFTGDIRLHPDFDAIDSFISAHGASADFVENCQITDVGGVICCI